MHPEVRQVGPGSCPSCGMGLEPAVIRRESGPGAEYLDMKKRALWATVFTVPLLIVSMGDMIGNHISAWLGDRMFLWLQFGLALPVCTWAAWPFYVRAVASVVGNRWNMFTLVGLGVSISFGYSVVAVLIPGSMLQSSLASPSAAVYFESAAVIVTLVLVGQILELSARSKTNTAVYQLLDLEAKFANKLLPDGSEQSVPIAELQVDDLFRVVPGQTVATDGTVVDGSSQVDESMFTGEATPSTKNVGDTVIGASINGNGALIVRATAVADQTLLARIIAVVSEAQRTQAPVQRIADQVAAYFVPAVLIIAIVAFGIWTWVGASLATALMAAVSVLIIACPCALGLATPMSITVAMGRAAESGILFRNAEAIESLCKVDNVLIDKTGTLTEGKPRVVAVNTEPGYPGEQVIALAASVERNSEHPIGSAIVDHANQSGIVLSTVQNFASTPGQGVRGEVDKRVVAIGTERYLSALGVAIPSSTSQSHPPSNERNSIVSVAIDGELAGSIHVRDPLRNTAAQTIERLHQQNIQVVMLTGDRRAVAEAVAAEVNIDSVHAGVLPDQKAQIVQTLKQQGFRVAMVGDGVNDAPALALATVGIAMGSGTDIAIESADVTIVRNDLRALLDAHALSRLTLRNIKQNLYLAFGYNAMGIPIAAGALYPVFGIVLSPMIAAAAMSLSSVSVITNALRLRSLSI